jgi:hypothetical protein
MIAPGSGRHLKKKTKQGEREQPLQKQSSSETHEDCTVGWTRGPGLTECLSDWDKWRNVASAKRQNSADRNAMQKS